MAAGIRCGIARGEIRLGDAKGARATLDLAAQDASLETFASTRVDLLMDIAALRVRAGDKPGALAAVDAARTAAETIADKVSMKLWRQIPIARMQARAGDAAGARRHLLALKELAAEVAPKKRTPIYQRVAPAQARVGDVEGATATTMLMVRGAREVTLLYVVRALAREGNVPAAISVAAQIGKQDSPRYITAVDTSASRAIASAYARAGDGDGVAQWIDAQADVSLRTYALIGAAEGLIRIEEQLRDDEDE